MTKTVWSNTSISEAFQQLPKDEQMLVMARAAVAELNRLQLGNQTANYNPRNQYTLLGTTVLPDSYVSILSESSKIPKVAIRAPPYFPLPAATEAETFVRFGLHSTRREINGEVMYIAREVRKSDQDEFEHADYRFIDGTRRFAASLKRGGGLAEL